MGSEMDMWSYFSLFLGIQTITIMIINIFWKPFSTDAQFLRLGQANSLILFALALIFIFFAYRFKKSQVISQLQKCFTKTKSGIYLTGGFLIGMILATIGALIGAFAPTLFNSLGWLGMVFRQTTWVLVLIGLSCLEILVFIFFQLKKYVAENWEIGKWYMLMAISFTLAITAVLWFVSALLLNVSFLHLITAFHLAIYLSVMSLIWVWGYLGVRYSQTKTWERIKPYPKLALIFLLTFVVLKITSIAVNNVDTPSKSYFDQLAGAFLQGKLYLENPSSTHDLTFYNGQWYLPFPPLAALLMTPLVKIYGDVGFSTVTFTIFFASINTALVYEMLRLLITKGWVRLKEKHLYWIVLSFVLGTPFWYMAIVGKVWYIERILALTFILLAVVLLLKECFSWVVGIAIGLSLWSRPNEIFLWPLFLGIYWQQVKDQGKLTFKVLARWTLSSAIPIILAVAALLYYNWARFGNWFDFGYQNQNVGENAANVVSEGFFNLKFILRNVYRMLISLPVIQESCKHIFVPNHLGMSIFFTSPALIYIFRSFQKKVFIIATWIALLVEIALLLLSNLVNWEFGYGYILDLIIPLLILMSIGAGEKVSWSMRILIILGIVVNFWGILWYFGYYCPVL